MLDTELKIWKKPELTIKVESIEFGTGETNDDISCLLIPTKLIRRSLFIKFKKVINGNLNKFISNLIGNKVKITYKHPEETMNTSFLKCIDYFLYEHKDYYTLTIYFCT